MQLYVWIQLLPHGDMACKLRVTVGAEINFFMKGMVAKPLQQAAAGLANMLSAIRCTHGREYGPGRVLP